MPTQRSCFDLTHTKTTTIHLCTLQSHLPPFVVPQHIVRDVLEACFAIALMIVTHQLLVLQHMVRDVLAPMFSNGIADLIDLR